MALFELAARIRDAGSILEPGGAEKVGVMASDFDGLLVVSIEQAVAATYLSCKLADGGARVIKIERPEGDFARQYDHLVHRESAYFVWLNRGKESI